MYHLDKPHIESDSSEKFLCSMLFMLNMSYLVVNNRVTVCWERLVADIESLVCMLNQNLNL